MSDPRVIYEQLLTQARQAPGHAYRAFDAPPGLSVRAFIDGLSRLPGVTLHAPAVSVPESMTLPKIRGAETSVRSEGSGDSRQVVYSISASEAAYSSVFVELASGLINAVAQSESAKEALTGVSRRLSAWVRFFDSRSREGLGRSAQLGLIGELICLQHLARLAGLSHAVRGWSGPAGSTHDFQTVRGAIEVKLSTTSAPERFRISSERQLDESTVPELLLCAISAQELPSGPVGLSDLVDSIRDEVGREAPADLGLLDERLLEAGFSEHDRQLYTVRINVLRMDFAHVHGTFPRVTPRDLRNGVFSVGYEIPRSDIISFIVPPQRAGEIIRGLD